MSFANMNELCEYDVKFNNYALLISKYKCILYLNKYKI